MATSDSPMDEVNPIESLIGRYTPIESAAETMMAASRTMLAASAAISFALEPASARARELTAEAIEIGFLRALRRETLLGGPDVPSEVSPLLRLPGGKGLTGTGYGRMGASITGKGARAQLYGTIGGAIGYAVGGPAGAILGGMLGGLLGGDDDERAEYARQQEEMRQWLNTPEGFEIQAYLYNIAKGHSPGLTLIPFQRATAGSAPSRVGFAFPAGQIGQVVVNLSPGAVQIAGQGEEAGERAARAFAGTLGRVLRLNSVVVPAAGLGGDI